MKDLQQKLKNLGKSPSCQPQGPQPRPHHPSPQMGMTNDAGALGKVCYRKVETRVQPKCCKHEVEIMNFDLNNNE